MAVLRVTVPDQYFCTKHPDLNITAREEKNNPGIPYPWITRNIHLWTSDCMIQQTVTLTISSLSVVFKHSSVHSG